MVHKTIIRNKEKLLEHTTEFAAIVAILILVGASLGALPASAQTYQDKSKVPNFIRAISDPSNTCSGSGSQIRCANAQTSGGAEVKVYTNARGGYWAKAYHEMDPIPLTTSGPSSGFTINVDVLGLIGRFTNYLEGKVQIQKNGLTSEARYGMYMCWQSSLGWHCDDWAYARKNTDGTFTIPAGSSVYTDRALPLGDPAFRTNLHTMGSLFECYTTGANGLGSAPRCDAYDLDKYWKSTKLRMIWPYSQAFAAQSATSPTGNETLTSSVINNQTETSTAQTNATQPVQIGIDFDIRPQNQTVLAEKGHPVTVPLKIDAPTDTQKNLKVKLVPERGNSSLAQFKATLSKQSIALSKNDVALGNAKIIEHTQFATRDAGNLTLTPPANLKSGDYTFAVEVEQPVDMDVADALVSGTLVHVQVK